MVAPFIILIIIIFIPSLYTHLFLFGPFSRFGALCLFKTAFLPGLGSN